MLFSDKDDNKREVHYYEEPRIERPPSPRMTRKFNQLDILLNKQHMLVVLGGSSLGGRWWSFWKGNVQIMQLCSSVRVLVQPHKGLT